MVECFRGVSKLVNIFHFSVFKKKKKNNGWYL